MLLTLIIYGTVIAGGFTLLLSIPRIVPMVPQEMRPVHNMVEGGCPSTSGRAVKDQDIARHDGGILTP